MGSVIALAVENLYTLDDVLGCALIGRVMALAAKNLYTLDDVLGSALIGRVMARDAKIFNIIDGAWKCLAWKSHGPTRQFAYP